MLRYRDRGREMGRGMKESAMTRQLSALFNQQIIITADELGFDVQAEDERSEG